MPFTTQVLNSVSPRKRGAGLFAIPLTLIASGNFGAPSAPMFFVKSSLDFFNSSPLIHAPKASSVIFESLSADEMNFLGS